MDLLLIYLIDVLVFFGSRSGLWCRHVLVKLSEHLEIGNPLSPFLLSSINLELALCSHFMRYGSFTENYINWLFCILLK
jgi:hypothetical protein